LHNEALKNKQKQNNDQEDFNKLNNTCNDESKNISNNNNNNNNIEEEDEISSIEKQKKILEKENAVDEESVDLLAKNLCESWMEEFRKIEKINSNKNQNNKKFDNINKKIELEKIEEVESLDDDDDDDDDDDSFNNNNNNNDNNEVDDDDENGDKQYEDEVRSDDAEEENGIEEINNDDHDNNNTKTNENNINVNKQEEYRDKIEFKSKVLNRNELILLMDKLPKLLNVNAQQKHHGRICFGLVGYPNVGKSSVINTILSVSKSTHGFCFYYYF
jgi:ribosome biogenesis GTPase A